MVPPMRQSLLTLGLCLALAACGAKTESTSSASSAAKSGHSEDAKLAKLSVDEVEKRLEKNDGKFYVFDNNSDTVYAEGHVPGAKHLPISDIKETDLPKDKEATLVFYCGNEQCTACHTAANAAINYGYKNVYIMPAGIKGWKDAKKKTESTNS